MLHIELTVRQSKEILRFLTKVAKDKVKEIEDRMEYLFNNSRFQEHMKARQVRPFLYPTVCVLSSWPFAFLAGLILYFSTSRFLLLMLWLTPRAA